MGASGVAGVFGVRAGLPSGVSPAAGLEGPLAYWCRVCCIENSDASCWMCGARLKAIDRAQGTLLDGRPLSADRSEDTNE